MDKRLALELVKARKNVRKKLLDLKHDLITSQLRFSRSMQPITHPIEKLLSEIKKAQPLDVKTEIKKEQPLITKSETKPEIKRDIITPERVITPKKGTLKVFSSKLRDTPKTSSGEDSIEYIPENVEPIEGEPDEYQEPLSEVELENIEALKNTDVFREWLDQWSGMGRDYIEEMITTPFPDLFDHRYGVRFQPEESKFYIGNSEIDFKNDKVLIDPKGDSPIDFPISKGLLELLFKKDPDRYNTTDLRNYRDIVKRTNADRKDYNINKQISGNAGKKYTTIIKKIQNPIVRGRTSRTIPSYPSSLKTHTSLKTTTISPIQKQSRGGLLKSFPTKSNTNKRNNFNFLEITNKDLEFVPWKNPNQLVDRLKLLMSSQTAGNNSHSNEMSHIVNELKNSKIIL
ncbi:hypothetical protein WA026_014141 [Henosepilachna vigintioctopunctata]|uniref:DUF8207 domain-containing protein n=1 Tax=Henosepilachna vigintioctopunctata TaxID=420089 RepID=A0AAW1TKF2_9CUCU